MLVPIYVKTCATTLKNWWPSNQSFKLLPCFKVELNNIFWAAVLSRDKLLRLEAYNSTFKLFFCRPWEWGRCDNQPPSLLCSFVWRLSPQITFFTHLFNATFNGGFDQRRKRSYLLPSVPGDMLCFKGLPPHLWKLMKINLHVIIHRKSIWLVSVVKVMGNKTAFLVMSSIFLWRGRITRMPCIRDIALRGLRALKVRIVLNAWIPPAPSSEAVKLIRETWTG